MGAPWSGYLNDITMGRSTIYFRSYNVIELSSGWRVDADSPTSISKAYHWITTLIKNNDPNSTESFTLFPVVVRPSNVLTYYIQRSGLALSRESQENIVPGDYGIYNEGKRVYFVLQKQKLASSKSKRLQMARRPVFLFLSSQSLLMHSGALVLTNVLSESPKKYDYFFRMMHPHFV